MDTAGLIENASQSERYPRRVIPVFTARDVETAVSPHEAYNAVRDAFVAYAHGEWSMPPKVYVTNYPAGDFRAMPALGGGHALLKWVTSFPGNPARGLPTVTGLVLLSDAEDGRLLAVLDAAARAHEAGATVIASGNAAESVVDADYSLPVPRPSSLLLAPLLSVVPGQLFAWALARTKGLDPDEPRGLSKVTLAR